MIELKTPWLERGDRLVCFGDSLTACKTGYVEILDKELTTRGITVTNAGLGGDKTPWALTRLQADVIERKPSAVSIFLGTNDAAVGRGRWADEPVVTPEAYRSNLVWIVHLCRLSGIAKFSITPPLWRFEGESWREFGDIMAPYCLMAREAAAACGARFVPADIAVAEEWARHPGHTGVLLTCEGCHPTAEGYALIARTMMQAWGLHNHQPVGL